MRKWSGYGAIFFLIFLFVVIPGTGQKLFAAESTTDVVVNSAQKEKIRQEIVGEMELPGEQDEYVVGYGDILSVSIYGEGDMAAANAVSASRPETGTPASGGGGDILRRGGNGVEVRMDGRVSLKHIGDVKVVGMSLTQLADYLKKLYVSVYDDPIVTVTLLQSNSRRYTVMGQVNNPGIFYLDFPVTLVQAIARSGGFTEWANRKMTVIRQKDKQANGKQESAGTMIKFDYDDFMEGKDLEKNIYLQPGDVLVVH